MASGKESLRLLQQQKLQQRLNPQSVALGRLLEMNALQIEDEVRRQLDENPALEVIDDADAIDQNESSPSVDADIDDEDTSYTRQQSTHRSSGFDYTLIAPDEGESLLDTMMHRLLDETDLDDDEELLAKHIIGNMDDNGYMTRSLMAIGADASMESGQEYSYEKLRKVFDAIRALDPAGIGAVDLRDCLMLQLDRLKPDARTAVAKSIVADYFDLFSKKHYERLLSASGVSKEELASALMLIQSLNPKPASSLNLARSSDRARHVAPDAEVSYDPSSDSFTVSLCGRIPEMGVEASFQAEMEPTPGASSAVDDRRRQAFAFIRSKREDADAFIGLIKMRGETLLLILTAIVKMQKAFFISGDSSDIRPMILRDISEVTGLDISVISRATAGKYVMCAHGIYPVKYLFNERPDADTDVSSHEILGVIQKLVEAEDSNSPLSDREITDTLVAKGYDIARRTTAKYREKLGIPVARLRRKL